MPLRVLIVPDKFKGTLSAAQAASAIAKGWCKARPNDLLRALPMNDGGDGFGAITADYLKAEVRETDTVDAAQRACRSRWWFQAADRIAIIEAAQVNGLAQLPKGLYHPFDLDTRGLGKVLREAHQAGARHCLIGLGGSATNDAGFGLATSLGWRFVTGSGSYIQTWTGCSELVSLIPPETQLSFESFQVAVDVQNPLLGPEGCSRIYGPQKGLTPADMPLADAALQRIADCVDRAQGSGRKVHHVPGAGAAGGLGFGFVAFTGALLTPGFDLFAKLSGLEAALGACDLVVTGEGMIDTSSLMGKGVGGILTACKARSLPCIGLAGHLGNGIQDVGGFLRLASLTQRTSPALAMVNAEAWLEIVAQEVAGTLDGEVAEAG